jgi:hypothetical protein
MIAETLVRALEDLEAPPTPEQIDAARRAVEAELAAATAAMFPPAAARPRSADDVTTFSWLTGRFAHATFGAQLAEAHRTALADSPGLAALARTSEALEDVAERAAAASPGNAAAGAAAVRTFQVKICESLAEGSEAPSDARAFLAAVDLEARLAAVEARAAERAAAAAARAAEERKAAARAARAARAEQIDAARLRADESREQAVRAEREYRKVRGEALAERIKLSGAEVIRDHVGRVFGASDLIAQAHDLAPHDIAAIERALDKLEAAQHEVVS